MSLAENLLETLDSSPNARTADPVSEPHIVVGNDRRIVVPPELKLIAVTGDKDVETVIIDCVRYWDEHDLSTFAIYINYTLPDGTKGSYIPFEFDVQDDKFSFQWTIGKEMTFVSGALEFLILARMVDDNGNEQYQWSSLPNSECSIAEGKDFLYTPETSEQQDQISQIIIASQQAISKSNEAVQKAEDAAERAEAAAGEDVENRLLTLEDAVADIQDDLENIAITTPTFDLAALGLDNVPTDGTAVTLEINTDEIMAALEAGFAKFSITATALDIPMTITPNIVKMQIPIGSAPTVYACSFATTTNGLLMIGNLVVADGTITASFSVIGEKPDAIDLSNFETQGKIVETYADGTPKTTTVEFDENGNPTKITDGDGKVTDIRW